MRDVTNPLTIKEQHIKIPLNQPIGIITYQPPERVFRPEAISGQDTILTLCSALVQSLFSFSLPKLRF